MRHHREMAALGLYPACYDIRINEWVIRRDAESQVISGMPLIERYGCYWERWK